MNAPVSEQIRAEAAKTLLERAKEKINLVRFFRYNASAKHGVPIEDEEITITPDEAQVREEPVPAQNIVQIVKTDDEDDDRIARLERELERQRELREQQAQSPTPINTGVKETSPSTMSDKVKGILQTLAVLGGLGAAGWTGYALSNGDEADKQVNGDQPNHISAPFYSPYQYLEDTGEHLP